MQGDSTPTNTVVITGALTYTGKYTTRLLLGRGYRVRTLTYLCLAEMSSAESGGILACSSVNFEPTFQEAADSGHVPSGRNSGLPLPLTSKRRRRSIYI